MSVQQHKAGSQPLPLSSSFITGSVRVRDNQRRSRARRKEYLQELEAKLRKCEALGVQASVDIQVAARAVSAENAKLRKENERLKDENARLRQELRESQKRERSRQDWSREKPTEPASPAEECIFLQDGNSIKLVGTQPLDPSGDIAEWRSHDTPSISKPILPIATPPSSPFTPSRTSRGSTARRSRTDSSDSTPTTYAFSPAAQTEGLQTKTLLGKNREPAITDDTSSCEYAARIITSMRADVNTNDIKADLGCGNNISDWRKCKVDNAKLFEAMDRYTG